MAELFSPQYWYLWAAALGIALFIPVRRLIWVLFVRRAQKAGDVDDAERARLHRRATVTAGLLCFVFAVIYTNYLFGAAT